MTVLGSAMVKQHLARGWIFKKGTYDTGPEGLWPAKYNLRVGRTLMVVPDGSRRGRKYDVGEIRTEPIILLPGQTALVSTEEEIRMPWSVSAIVGPKASIARKGLLVLTGSVVDPGFGLRWDAKKRRWVEEYERLYFLVANLSRSTQTLVPATTRLASIQFLEIDGQLEEREVTSTEDTIREFFQEDGLERSGLAFFTELGALSEELDKFKIQFQAVERGTTQLIFFGVFLLSVTLLAACVTILLTVATSERLKTLNALSWPTIGKVFALCGGIAAAVAVLVGLFWVALRLASRGR